MIIRIVVVLLQLFFCDTAHAQGPFSCEAPLTCPTPAAIDYETGTSDDVNELIDGTRGFFEGTISTTVGLSNTLHTAIVAEDVITATNVPDWYAPSLPRPVAQLGWQFETMSSDLRRRYSLAEWTSFIAQAIVVPIKLVKGLFVLGRYLGPLGLFLGWLFVMLPFVLWMKLAGFIKNLVIQIFNFIIQIIRLIGDIWDMFPFA